MNKKILLSFFVTFILTAQLTFADGGFFPPDYSHRDISEPEQVALLIYSEGVQKLVIMASYEGAPSDFSWIVPLPSPPNIKSQEKEVFSELHHITRPNYRRVNIPFFMFSSRGISGGVSDEVDVISREVVGVYDTAVISSDNPLAIIEWLQENNYRVNSEAEEIITYYTDKDWYFAAIKIRDEMGRGEGSIHPLLFEFETSEPVYPLRISSLNKGKTEVLLYVISDSKMSPSNYNQFKLEYVDKLNKSSIAEHIYRYPRHERHVMILPYLIPHEEFVLAKYRSNLRQRDMVADVEFEISEYDGPFVVTKLEDGFVIKTIILFIIGLIFFAFTIGLMILLVNFVISVIIHLISHFAFPNKKQLYITPLNVLIYTCIQAVSIYIIIFVMMYANTEISPLAFIIITYFSVLFVGHFITVKKRIK